MASGGGGSNIKVVGGLDSGSAISVNSAGDSSSHTYGTIWIGGADSRTPSTIPVAGSISINACDGGTFSGLVKIVGCSAVNHAHANVCINGVNSGTISYYGYGCAHGFSILCTGPCGG